MKKLTLVASMAVAMSVSAPAQAGWFDSVVSWVDNNIINPVEEAVVDAVNWLDSAIITPTGELLQTVEEYAAYIEVVEDTMTDTGYSSSGGAPFSLPNTAAGASGTLKVMSYNVHGFPEVLQGISDAQARSVSSLLESWDYDIVGLQEDWVINGPLMSNLSTSTYPGRTNHYGGTMTSFGDGLVTIAGGAIDPNQAQRIQFNLCDGTLEEFLRGDISSPDCATEKGFTIAEVHLASDLSVHVYNTHFNTGSVYNVNQESLNQIANKINTYSIGKPVVLLGDFNMWLTEPTMAAQFSEFTANTGLRWSCEDLNSCDGRIDLIAYRGNEQFDFTTLSEATIDDNGISDHAPRAATLHWINKAKHSNLALGKNTEQASDYPGNSAARAVDGNTNGSYGYNSVTHTLYEMNAWWQVDLGASAELAEIELFNRTDCCTSRLQNFTVFVSDTPFGSRSYDDLKNDASIWQYHHTGAVATSVDIRALTQGRYVRVQLDHQDYLSLAEVQIWGSDSVPVVNGNWSNSGGRDANHSGNPVYALNVPASGPVTLDLTSAVDTYLYLKDSNGSVIGYNDDGGSGYNSKLSMSLNAGSYSVVAATYSGGQSGSFELSVSGGSF